MSSQRLLSEFDVPGEEAWREAAEKLLKGAPFDKVMRTRTVEGLTLEPIYSGADGLPQAAATLPGFDGGLRGGDVLPTGWEIAQEQTEGEPGEFNHVALEALRRGQDALHVLLDVATARGLDPDQAGIGEVGACGLSLATLADLRRAFRDILPDAVAFHFQSGSAGYGVYALFTAWIEELGVDPALVRGRLNMDPLAVLARSGSLPAPLERLYDEMAAVARHAAKTMPRFRAAGVDALAAHGAGASAVQELGVALAGGVATLRALSARGLDVDAAASQMAFSLSVGPDFFMELAKLRAARPLWARIVGECGGGAEAARMMLHCRTGLYNKTVYDPYVNLLRTTTEAMAAAVGGADSICVGAFDEAIRPADGFSRRLARNTQVILREECELGVADPAGGSWFVENLTESVSQAAWEFFREIEGQGGYVEVLASGWLAEKLAATHAERCKRLAARRLSLVGTNQYPNPQEKPLDPSTTMPDYADIHRRRSREVASFRTSGEADADAALLERLGGLADAGDGVAQGVAAVRAGASLAEITRAVRAGASGEVAQVTPLPSLRLSAMYESLRKASAAHASKHGEAPKIFLATLGALRRHKARADFTRAFFATGGFVCEMPSGFEDGAAAAAAAVASGARATVICGHDEDYLEHVPALCRALKAGDPGMRVILAGFPGDNEAAWREAGLDDYIFIKSDNYAKNRELLELLGVIAP